MPNRSVSTHPFGELLNQYRQRKPGLSQRRLAELAGYDQAILVRMAQGKKDLTGPSGRERVVRVIETLADQGALATLDEANGLLAAANQPPLFDGQPNEARLLTRLSRASSGHRVRRTNLPAPLAGFVGRAQEISEVRDLLSLSRLVTLTGAGGAGKTRLAQRVAADLLLQFTDGVWYAELAALTDTALIPETVARIFGLTTSSQTSFDDLAHLLRERHMLLVLDNCEHLIDGAADFAQRLLGECARLSILATSREALNVEGEATWRVPPMQPHEAARLFVDRARLAKPQQMLREDDATVAHICERLDGMPLALELAAARLNTLRLNDIAARLDNRFALLTEGRRGALPRHQTLQALIDWSYELLGAQEKMVFRRLGVFMGGWTLEAATQVVCDDAVDERDVLPVLTQLVRKSLVTVEERAGETRYTFLETIRQYALERLADHGELDEMRLRHAQAFEALAWECDRMINTSLQLFWYHKMLAHFPNLRQAITWSMSSGHDVIGCSIVGGLFHLLVTSMDYLAESSRWSALALQRMPDELAARARGYLYMLPGFVGIISTPELIVNMRHALASFEAAAYIEEIANVKVNLARLLFKLDPDSSEGRQLMDEAYALAVQTKSDWLLSLVTCIHAHDLTERQLFEEALTLYNTCVSHAQRGQHIDNCMFGEYMIVTTLMNLLRFDEALEHIDQQCQLAAQIDDALYYMYGQLHIAFIDCLRGDTHRAIALAEAAFAKARERVSLANCKMGMAVLARICAEAGALDRARVVLRQLIEVMQNAVSHTRGWYGGPLDIAACIASVAGGNALRVATLFGAADEEYGHAHLAMVMIEAISLEAFNGHRARYYAHANAPHIAKARAALGNDAYEAAYAEGRAMPLAQAIEVALAPVQS